MKKSTILIGGLAVLGLSALWLFYGGQGRAVGIYSNSKLEIEETFFNFGKVSLEEGLVEHKFKVINRGEEAVMIEKIYTSCMCTTALVLDEEDVEMAGPFGMPGHGVSVKTEINVLPGEEKLIKAVFDPAAHGPAGIGLARRSIYLETNSSSSPKVEFVFEATVIK